MLGSALQITDRVLAAPERAQRAQGLFFDTASYQRW